MSPDKTGLIWDHQLSISDRNVYFWEERRSYDEQEVSRPPRAFTHGAYSENAGDATNKKLFLKKIARVLNMGISENLAVWLLCM